MKLAKKQAVFVSEYLIDLNATQAAIRAGYSEKTAQEQASRLLSNVMVQKAIEEALSKRSAKAERKAADVLADVQELAQTAKLEYMNEPTNHHLLNSTLKALELEGKHLGVSDKLELTGAGGKDLSPPSFTVVFSSQKEDED